MAAKDSSPKIDRRSYADLVAQTEQLATYYTGGKWAPDNGKPELGAALIRIFARMMTQVVDRLNQTPEKAFLAFVDLLGAQRLPPRPARVPLTFRLAETAQSEAIVPAGTPVAAAAEGDLPDAVFETESELGLTRARLAGVYVVRPDLGGYVDVTGVATGARQGAFVAVRKPVDPGAVAVPDHTPFLSPPRALFVESQQVFGLHKDVASLTCTLELDTATDQAHLLEALSWKHHDGSAWQDLPYQASGSGGSWTVVVDVPLPVAEITIAGQTGRFVRAGWYDQPVASPLAPPRTITIAASVKLSDRDADKAYANAAALDLSRDFLPFGERPRLGDVFLIASADVFEPGKAERQVKISIMPSQACTNEPHATWEYWNGRAWKTLTPAAGGLIFAGTAETTVTLAIPAESRATTVNGVTNQWLRLRLEAPDSDAASYKKLPFVDYTPPCLKSLRLEVVSPEREDLESGHTQSGFDYAAWKGPGAPFGSAPTLVPGLYLGFDRAFSPRPVSLYLQADPPAPDEVAAVERAGAAGGQALRNAWRYFTAKGTWSSLATDDETAALTRSGLARLVGPTDPGATAAFDRPLYWLRLDALGVFELERRLRHLSLNTVWARHATTVVNEVLGSSDGSVEQELTLAQTPVLLGQRIEVDEGEPPSADELAALVALEGEDAVTLVPATADRPAQAWVRWHAVPDFHGSGPGDRHYVIDHARGTIQFGDGASGRIPRVGAHNIRARWYQWGGGLSGNRRAGTVTQLRNAVPYVEAVTNLEDAAGGAAAESTERVKSRTTRILRHGWRAVTKQDFEDLAFEASPAVARALALTPTFNPIDHSDGPRPDRVEGKGKVLLVVVPASEEPQPVPTPELLAEVHDYVNGRCPPAAALQVTGPNWTRVSVTAKVVLRSMDAADLVHAALDAAVRRYLHPLSGRDGQGWDFGRQPHTSDLHKVLAAVDGVHHVASLQLDFDPSLEIDMTPTSVPNARTVNTYLTCSGDHQIETVARDEDDR
jgi:hypothetical protein